MFYGDGRDRPLGRASYHVMLAKAIRAAVERDPNFPLDISSHDLRHHYASVLLHGGESVPVVAARLGGR